MKRVLIVLEGYINLSEANAICIDSLVKIWKKSNIIVDILSIENKKCSEYDNVYILENRYTSKNNTIRRINKFLNMPIGSRKLAEALTRRVCELAEKNKYNCIVCTVNPVETANIIPNIKIKYPNIRCILYEIDPTSNRYKTPKNFIEKLWKHRAEIWEAYIYKYSDLIVHMKTHRQHFSNQWYDKFNEKTIYLDIPCLTKKYIEKSNDDFSGKKKVVYAGSFYPELRNPRQMIDILWQYSRKHSIQVDIYTGKNMWDTLMLYIKDKEEVFKLHEFVSQDELDSIFSQSDALLDLGNKDSDFLPSKTIQYIGTGLPIIHFAPDMSDVTIPYLKKYENCLLIFLNEYDIRKYIQQIQLFLDKKQREMDFSKKLEEVFVENTPKYTADRLEEYF